MNRNPRSQSLRLESRWQRKPPERSLCTHNSVCGVAEKRQLFAKACHRGFSRRFIAMRWRAILVVSANVHIRERHVTAETLLTTPH